MARVARPLIRLALLAVVLAVVTHTRADPDLWGHVRFGQDTLRQRALDSIDRYSFVSDRPWINHEWAAEVVMYGAYATGGSTGLILLKAALVLFTLLCIAASLPTDAAPRSKDLIMALALIGTVPQSSHVRPQLFSLALFAALLAVLVCTRFAERRAARTMALAAIMAIWANVHGGWIVGASTLSLWGGLDLLRTAGARRRASALVAVLIPLTATLANPYGWRLWGFLRETMGFGRAQITDWQPVMALGPAFVAIWMLVLAAVAWTCSRGLRSRVLDPRLLAIAALLAAGSFQVNRLLGFFAIAAAFLAAPVLTAASVPASEPRPDPIPTTRRPALGALLATAVALLLLSGSSLVALTNFGCIKMDPNSYPEVSAAAFARAHAIRGRMLTWFDWGEYAIWHFAPDVTVSLDGRRETVYSDAAIERQFHFYFAPADRQATIDALRPDYIWLPARLEVTTELRRDGWHVLYAGERSVLLSRTQTTAVAGDTVDSSLTRCFPGP